MVMYALRRLAQSGVIVFIIMTGAFFLLRVVPGDPVLLAMGVQTPPSVIHQLREQLGLDRPIPVQYIDYVEGLFQGNLGDSLRQHQPAFPLIMSALLKSAALATCAMVIGVLLALSLGAVSALNRGAPLDRLVMTFALISQSAPGFWIGTMLILLFAVHLRLLPSLGLIGPASLILPSVTLALGVFPVLTKYVRSRTSEVLAETFVLSLRSRGLSDLSILSRHVLKNISVPLITIISQQSGYLLAGAFIIEYVFNYPGIGLLGIVAAQTRDLPLLQGIVVVVSVVFVLINLAIDLLYTTIDPRIRYA